MMRQNAEFRPAESEQPLDSVTQIVWEQSNSNQQRFLTASWDGFVRLYAVSEQLGGKVSKQGEMFLQHPVLCLDLDHNGIAFAGLASGDIAAVQYQKPQMITLGNHAAPICGLFWIRQMSMLMSLGFDTLIKFWKIDCNPVFQAEFKLPFKTAACSFNYPYLLIGSIQTTVAFVNLSRLPNLNLPKAQHYKKVDIQRFSKFNCCKVQAKCGVAIFGTIDGRVVIMNFRELSNGDFEITNSLVSKTQKRTVNGKEFLGQVNTVDIGINGNVYFVVIGGSDEMGIYNHYKRTKGKTIVLPQNGQNIATTAVSFNPKQGYLAYAVGYDWLRGLYDQEQPKRPKIAVMKVSKNEISTSSSK